MTITMYNQEAGVSSSFKGCFQRRYPATGLYAVSVPPCVISCIYITRSERFRQWQITEHAKQVSEINRMAEARSTRMPPSCGRSRGECKRVDYYRKRS